MKYIGKEIKENRWLFVIFLIMNVVMLYLMGNLFHMMKHSQERMETIRQFENGYEGANMVIDNTSQEDLEEMWAREEETKNKFRSILQALYDENITFFTEFGYEVDPEQNGRVINQQMVSQNFFDLYGMSPLEGRLLTQEEYEKKTDVVPVIVGYGLKEKYQMGNEYEFVNGGDGETFRGKVIGVLKKNTSFCELSNYDFSVSLDHSYVVPMVEENLGKMSFSDLDMAITRMVTFGNKDIVQRAFSLAGIDTITLRDVAEQVHLVVEEETTNTKRIVCLTLVVLVLVFAITWIGFYRLFQKNKKNYVIHMFCGAKWNTIWGRFVLSCAITLAASWGIVCCLLKDGHMTITLLLVCLLVLVVTSIYPLVKIRREL